MKFIYGPVPSRRLGRSLGVNVTPLKTCTFNCVYCQLGGTTQMTDKRQDFFQKEEIINEIKSVIDKKTASSEIDYITFAGEGEPTLCKSLGEIIDYVKERCTIPVGVLTNSSTLFDKEVRKDLLNADLVMPSLDAGSEKTFRKINRPIKNVNLEKILNGLEEFRLEFKGKLWLEIMLVKDVNDSKTELMAIKNYLNKVKPDRIYLNFPIRPPAEEWVKIPDKRVLEVAEEVLGDIFEITYEELGEFTVEKFANPIEAIEHIIRRHPMREEQVLEVLNEYKDIDLNKTLEELIQSRRVIINEYRGKRFLKWASGDK